MYYINYHTGVEDDTAETYAFSCFVSFFPAFADAQGVDGWVFCTVHPFFVGDVAVDFTRPMPCFRPVLRSGRSA